MKSYKWLIAASIIQTFTATLTVSSGTVSSDTVSVPYVHTPPAVIYTTSTCDAGTCKE